MYPSDYGYSTSGDASSCDITMRYWNDYPICYGNSWLYDSNGKGSWTITPRSDVPFSVHFIQHNGNVIGQGGVSGNSHLQINPTLYLNSNVKIVDGLGTDQQPYILGT